MNKMRWAYAILLLLGCCSLAFADTFTFQGKLSDSSAATNGIYDFQFELWDALGGGSQIGATLSADDVFVIDGLFAVDLNFTDPTAFDGSARWLQISAKADADGTYTPLTPRQPIHATPYAIHAYRAAGVADGGLGSTYTSVIGFTNPGNHFTGNGSGLTKLNASELTTGNVGAARMPTGGNWSLGSSLHVDSNTLVVDPANNRVGIGTAIPTNPLHVAMSAQAESLYAVNTNATYGISIFGQQRGGAGATPPGGAAVFGSSDTWYGVVGFSSSGTGIYGSSNDSAGNGDGVVGGASGSGFGVRGAHIHSTAQAAGVFGNSFSTSGSGVEGWALATTGVTYGVRGVSNSTSGRGVLGDATAASGATHGVIGQSASIAGTGVQGEATALAGTTYGMFAKSSSPAGYGIYTENLRIAGPSYALYAKSGGRSFESAAIVGELYETQGFGVMGIRAPMATAMASGWPFYGAGVYGYSQQGSGMYAESTSTIEAFGIWATSSGELGGSGTDDGVAVFGQASAVNGTGVWGLAQSGGSGASTGGVFSSDSTNGTGASGGTAATSITYTAGVGLEGIGGNGVRGESTVSNGNGVIGIANGSAAWAVVGVSDTGYGGYFIGDVFVTQDLTVSGTKNFVIDHPLDPANRNLYHACVESSEPLNTYSGTIVTDITGYATVQLPNWFEVINTDFRYQLTIIDEADSDDWVLAKVTEELRDNQFTIRTSVPGTRVSWEVTGVRNDAHARAHPFVAERDKPVHERGYYLRPDLYGQGIERGMAAAKAALSEQMQDDPSVIAVREAIRAEMEARLPRVGRTGQE